MDPVVDLYKSEASRETMDAFYDHNIRDYGDLVQSRFVPTRFGRTHCIHGGPKDGPPVLLLQGMAGNAGLWHHQLACFAHELRFFAVDQPGQPGRSDPVIPNLKNDDIPHWINDLLDGLELKRCSIVGISTGGWFAVRYAMFAPGRVDKLIVLSPLKLARARTRGGSWARTSRRSTTDEELEDQLTVREFSPESDGKRHDRKLARAMALASRHYRLAAAMGVNPDASRLAKTVAVVAVVSYFLAPAPLRKLRRLSTPTLAIFGAHDTLFNAQRAVKRCSRIPAVRARIVADAGHAVVFDKPNEVNPMMVDFLLSR